MTKLLDRAIAKVLELPEEEQDAVAAAMLSVAGGESADYSVDEATSAAIREGLEQARRGEFVPDDEMKALWERHGV